MFEGMENEFAVIIVLSAYEYFYCEYEHISVGVYEFKCSLFISVQLESV